METYSANCLVEVELLTDRIYQIRVHIAAIDHPDFIYAVYAKRSGFLLSELKEKKFNLAKKLEEEKSLIDR